MNKLQRYDFSSTNSGWWCKDADVAALEDALSECEAEKAAWEAKEKALRELAKQCNLKAAAIFEQYGEWHGEEDAIIMGRDEAADEMLAILNREQEKQPCFYGK